MKLQEHMKLPWLPPMAIIPFLKLLTINVGDINEAPSLTSTLAAESFAENVATGTTIATSSASDPEAGTITYSIWHRQ